MRPCCWASFFFSRSGLTRISYKNMDEENQNYDEDDLRFMGMLNDIKELEAKGYTHEKIGAILRGEDETDKEELLRKELVSLVRDDDYSRRRAGVDEAGGNYFQDRMAQLLEARQKREHSQLKAVKNFLKETTQQES